MVLTGYGEVPLEYLQVADVKNSATVIFLHGVASCGKETKEMFLGLLGEDAYIKHIKFVFPTAPTGYLKYFNKVTTMWFDTVTTELVCYDDVKSSLNYVESVYKAEVASGMAPNRIVLGGFSQGGSLALGLAYTRAKEVCGAAVMNGIYDVKYQQVEGDNLPELCQVHGSLDYLMPLNYARKGFAYLQSKNVKGTFRVYNNKGHELHKEALVEIYEFIKRVLPP